MAEHNERKMAVLATVFGFCLFQRNYPGSQCSVLSPLVMSRDAEDCALKPFSTFLKTISVSGQKMANGIILAKL